MAGRLSPDDIEQAALRIEALEAPTDEPRFREHNGRIIRMTAEEIAAVKAEWARAADQDAAAARAAEERRQQEEAALQAKIDDAVAAALAAHGIIKAPADGA
ncbi:hypothetical protein [Vineibacter terrae]|uniref:hypothetical protein n=1 Tax=Vineibacter terrae TaxID=2586908 RepID=UPI0015B421CC|nr:hypothetical protein [Vineibacter terrae]